MCRIVWWERAAVDRGVLLVDQVGMGRGVLLVDQVERRDWDMNPGPLRLSKENNRGRRTGRSGPAWSSLFLIAVAIS